jgi:hypothetical protein
MRRIHVEGDPGHRGHVAYTQAAIDNDHWNFITGEQDSEVIAEQMQDGIGIVGGVLDCAHFIVCQFGSLSQTEQAFCWLVRGWRKGGLLHIWSRRLQIGKIFRRVLQVNAFLRPFSGNEATIFWSIQMFKDAIHGEWYAGQNQSQRACQDLGCSRVSIPAHTTQRISSGKY